MGFLTAWHSGFKREEAEAACSLEDGAQSGRVLLLPRPRPSPHSQDWKWYASHISIGEVASVFREGRGRRSHTPLILHMRKLGLTSPWACRLGGQSGSRVYGLWSFPPCPGLCWVSPRGSPQQAYMRAGTVTSLTLQMRRLRHEQAGHLPKALQRVGRGPGRQT